MGAGHGAGVDPLAPPTATKGLWGVVDATEEQLRGVVPPAGSCGNRPAPPAAAAFAIALPELDELLLSDDPDVNLLLAQFAIGPQAAITPAATSVKDRARRLDLSIKRLMCFIVPL